MTEVKIVPITPAMAEEWLRTKNTRNRKLKPSAIARYAKDMLAGRWTLNNDAICFDETGVLMNGQNRLTAIVRTGVTVDMLVMYGVSTVSFKNLDSGVKRSGGDVLYVEGYENAPAALAAATRLAYNVVNDRPFSGAESGVTASELVDFVNENPVLEVCARQGRRMYEAIGGAAAGWTVAHFLIFQRNGLALATHFADKVVEPYEEPKGSPINALRMRVIRTNRRRAEFESRGGKNERYFSHHYLYIGIKAWNVYAHDGRVASLSMVPAMNAALAIPPVAKWEREWVPTEDDSDTAMEGKVR